MRSLRILALFCSVAHAGENAPAYHIAGVPVYQSGIHSHSNGETSEWIMMTRSNVSDIQVHALCEDADDCTAEGHPSQGGLGFVSIHASRRELESIVARHAGELEFLEPGYLLRAPPVREASQIILPSSKPHWHLDRIDQRRGGTDGLYKPSGDGEGVHVYVLDTGIRTTHRDFEGRAVPAYDSNPREGRGGKGASRGRACEAGDPSCARDAYGHGTHVAGTIGGAVSGVAKAVTIHSVKVTDDEGLAEMGPQLESMDWVARNARKPAIVSMSLGGHPGSAPIKAEEEAIKLLNGRGITVVVAAGNENADACGVAPAYHKNAITVGAADTKDRKSSFSNFGRCVDIWAPGDDIISSSHKTDTDFYKAAGTSSSAPMVSGAAALYLQQNPSATPADVTKGILAAATKDVVNTNPKPSLFLFVGGSSPSPPAPPGPSRRRRLNPVTPPSPPPPPRSPTGRRRGGRRRSRSRRRQSRRRSSRRRRRRRRRRSGV